ncbi:MAG: YdeI/OmpD-associated family protein [Ktedonobacteraceae bacterium]
MEIGETLLVHTAAEWRAWLALHHAAKKEIWLVYYKKTSGKTGITYEESVEQALCFGWIDGAIKGIDAETYAGRFTPRRAKSPWSESNRERVARVLKDGRMTEAGLVVLPEDLRGIAI